MIEVISDVKNGEKNDNRVSPSGYGGRRYGWWVRSYFLTREGEEKEEVKVPVYPGASPSGISVRGVLAALGIELPAGISFELYTFEATQSEVLNWYRAEMPAREWVKIGDENQDGYWTLGYLKGGTAAGISVGEEKIISR